MDKTNEFGYPKTCKDCFHLQHRIGLTVNGGYYREGNDLRLMLVGQDPTIDKRPEEVEVPLMLNSTKRSNLRKWLSNEVGIKFDEITVYATNVVKCTFDAMPSMQKPNPGLKFLEPFYEKCSLHLKNEIEMFKPNVVLTFGEPAHKLFIRQLENYPKDKLEMTSAFDGIFETVKLKDSKIEFKYSPSLHIKTFRVAITYGDKVKKFKDEIKNILHVN